MKPVRKRRTHKGIARAQAPLSYPIDAAWKMEVRRIMEERGLSQARLAAQIGCVPSALVFMFKPATRSSTMVPAIHEALGLVPPSIPVATQAIGAA